MIETLYNYLEDLLKDILDHKENPRYIAWKIRTLIDKLKTLEKEEEEFQEIFIS